MILVTENLNGSFWRLEEAYEESGEYQMQRDEELTRMLANREIEYPILRLYSWSPACLSLGFQQKEDSINREACAKHGIDIVRRPTGGRAVLHKQELTYSVIFPEPPETSISKVHNQIAGALLKSLDALGSGNTGLTLTGTEQDQGFREVYKPSTLTNIACFISTARNEITYRSRKVVGSAQRRMGGVVLQHGSILLNSSHLLLPELLRLSDEARAKVRAQLERETATLGEVFGREITIAEAASCVKEHFVRHICEAGINISQPVA